MKGRSLAIYFGLALFLSLSVSYGTVAMFRSLWGDKPETAFSAIAKFFGSCLGDPASPDFAKRFNALKQFRATFPALSLDFWVVEASGTPTFRSTEDPPLAIPPSLKIMGGPEAQTEHVSVWRWVTFQKLPGREATWLVGSFGRPGLKTGIGMRWALVFAFTILLCTTVTSFGLLLFVFRLKAGEARRVLTDMARGKLGARMKIRRYDEVGGLMLSFNEMAARIEHLVQSLRGSEETRKRLLGELSHDLRTPLTAVRVTLDSLRNLDGKSIEPGRERLIRLASRELAYMERLLRYLFALAQSGDPYLEVKLGPLVLNELLKEEIDARSGLEKGREDGKRWTCAVPSEPLRIVADGEQLRRLLRNLLDNARKYAASTVSVTLEFDGDEAVLKISDDGPGLKGDPFASPAPNRLESTEPGLAAQADTSLGLGSSIVRAVAEFHDWDVTVPTTSSGTTIQIRLRLEALSKAA